MRTLFLASIVMLISVTAIWSDATAKVPQDKINVFDGWFMPSANPSDTFPVAFQDINLIQVVAPTRAKAPPYGYIEFKRGSTYPLLKPTLDGLRLSFKTKVVRGVSYEFNGTLLKTEYDNLEELNNTIVLTGTLKKLQAGKVIVEDKVAFGWFAGD